MESTKEVSQSVSKTIKEIKVRYNKDKKIQYLKDTNKMMRNTHRLEGRELSEWNASIFKKYRRAFDNIVRDVCKRNGRSEDHIRRVTGWKRGKSIINLNNENNES